LLQLKLEDTIALQQRASEQEDYEQADTLNGRILQTRSLIQSKEAQAKRLEEDFMQLENRKSDKYKELSALIHRSLDKIETLREKQNDDLA
jgi:thiamine biosynthesis lipoprotein ApbE